MIGNMWHLRGSTQLPDGVSDDVVLDRLATFLAEQDKPIAEWNDASIRFSAPFWENWVSNQWLALVIYDEGKFQIENGLGGRFLQYDLRSLHGFIFCLLGSLLFFALIGSVEGYREGAKVGLIAFSWLYGANLILAWIRIPAAIRRALIAE